MVLKKKVCNVFYIGTVLTHSQGYQFSECKFLCQIGREHGQRSAQSGILIEISLVLEPKFSELDGKNLNEKKPFTFIALKM